MKYKKSPYYDLDKIPAYRLSLIDKATKEFKSYYGLKNTPLDCVHLAINTAKQGNIRFRSTADLPPGKLARTIYVREMDMYFVSVNQSQLYDEINRQSRYPFRYSSDRMVNFTIAHEFGHIFLGHADIPDKINPSLTP